LDLWTTNLKTPTTRAFLIIQTLDHPWTTLDHLGPPWTICDIFTQDKGVLMFKDINELIAKLDNLVRRLKHLPKDKMGNTLHLVELFCELSDVLIEFDIEHYQDSESSQEDSQENKKPT
jgi:hypothetical protein